MLTRPFERGKLCRIELLPVSLSVARVALAQGEEFEAICARMAMLCGELGTQLKRGSDRLLWTADHASQGVRAG